MVYVNNHIAPLQVNHKQVICTCQLHTSIQQTIQQQALLSVFLLVLGAATSRSRDPRGMRCFEFGFVGSSRICFCPLLLPWWCTSLPGWSFLLSLNLTPAPPLLPSLPVGGGAMATKEPAWGPMPKLSAASDLPGTGASKPTNGLGPEGKSRPMPPMPLMFMPRLL